MNLKFKEIPSLNEGRKRGNWKLNLESMAMRRREEKRREEKKQRRRIWGIWSDLFNSIYSSWRKEIHKRGLWVSRVFWTNLDSLWPLLVKNQCADYLTNCARVPSGFSVAFTFVILVQWLSPVWLMSFIHLFFSW